MTEHIRVYESEPHPTTLFTRVIIEALDQGIITEKQLLALDKIRIEMKERLSDN